MTGFVYKWTNTVNGKWYIGSHKGTPDDGYRHSSTIMESAEKKHGLDSFIREILFEGDYEVDRIREKEGILLRFYDAANDPMSYNKTNISGPACFSKEMRSRMSRSKKEYIKKNGPMKMSEEAKEKIRQWNLKNSPKGMLGKKRPDKYKNHMKVKMKGVHAKPMYFKGTIYPSRKDAAAAHGIKTSSMRWWILKGKAYYV